MFINRTALVPTPTDAPRYSPITVPLEAKKQLLGTSLTEGQFRFLLKDAAGNTVSDVANQADGTVVFDSRTFSREGVFLYHMSEVKDPKPGITYDSNSYLVRISVSQRSGQLTAGVRFLKNGETITGIPLFINHYGTPETGDRALDLPLALMLLSLALAAGAIGLAKRERLSNRKDRHQSQ